MELEFIVVDTRIDSRPKIPDARVSCFELPSSIRASSPSNVTSLKPNGLRNLNR